MSFGRLRSLENRRDVIVVNGPKTRLIVGLILIPAISLAAAEVAMRYYLIGSSEHPELFELPLLRVGHSERGWTTAPQASGLLFSPLYSNYVSYNKKGLRGGERSYRPEPGV